MKILPGAPFVGLLLVSGAAGGAGFGEPALAREGVRVTILEAEADRRSRRDDASVWKFAESASVTDEYREPAFGFLGVPRRYSKKGIVVDRSNPFLIRAEARLRLRAGNYRLLLRSFNAARLYLDGVVIVATPVKAANADGHEPVPELPQAAHPDLRPLGPGHSERLVEVEIDALEHEFRLEAVVGGKSLRPEVGELSVSLAPAPPPAATDLETDSEGGFRLLSPAGLNVPMSESGWREYARDARQRLARRERENRRAERPEETEYWRLRHELARRRAREMPVLQPPRVARSGVESPIDRFVLARLEARGVEPAPLADDRAFLRRVSLDTRGVPPTPEEVASFLSEDRAGRRARWIDRMLDSPDWADHWVAYWQDVLAENPGILKPKLNNTGPFRWWIHESFLDDKPMDRFVTELILMEGSSYGGGPAGFAMATQNDAPMAAKAHIIATAFLGVEMKCARCHDAPHHSSTQKELFSLAAMLSRKAQEVPPTSTVPRTKEELGDMMIEVTLEPGSRVEPRWPFPALVAAELAAGVLRREEDSRERLAALVTSPGNERFARVIVNRLWKRYLGHGLVEPVDDWEAAVPSHPGLLEFLGRELLTHDYDLKHVARLILNSQTYQRQVRGDVTTVPPPEERLFVGPARRRLTAEQLVDSLFRLAGKSFESEELNLDVDGRRPITTFLNLGSPARAWEFATLSNERDRPALAMPVAQSILDLLQTFGWRETRQSPLTVRESVATVLQPLILANGTVAHRITTLSDDHAVTALCLEEIELVDLITAVVRRVLTRDPTAGELELFRSLLAAGFETRVVAAAEASDGRPGRRRHAVSWSNHLSAEATRIKMELERDVRRGDPPTERLDPDWRARMEDMLWALVNSPEFLFVP